MRFIHIRCQFVLFILLTHYIYIIYMKSGARQPFPQVLASVLASTCNRPRKYLQSSLQVLAVKRRHYVGISSPMSFCWSMNISLSSYWEWESVWYGKRIDGSVDFLTSSLLFAIRWRTMIISELRRIIGWFWVAQAKKCILCTMYVPKKHNRSGSTSVVVVSKASGKYREIKSGSSEIWSGA